MMTKLSEAQNEMYSNLISAYLEHSMTEHATDDSLRHIQEVFDRVFGLHGEGLYKSSLFLLDTAGQVRINLTGNDQLTHLTPEVFDRVKSLNEDFNTIRLNNLDTEFSILRLENSPRCVKCHGEEGDSRGYIGISVQKEEFLSFAAGHSTNNMFWMAIIIILVTGSMMMITYLFVIRPIKKLEDQFQLVTHHIGQSAESLEPIKELELISSRDEIGSLGENFNIMLQRLNQSRARLKAAHEESLMRADRLVSTAEMAASLAHEIKNPLAGVMGALEVIHKKTEQEDQYKDTLAEVNRQLFRINHTLDDLLVFARPSKPSFNALDINQVIEATLKMLKAQPAAKAIQFEFSSANETNMINGDVKQISQVFWNILSNAFQAMPNGGSLSVSIDRSSDYIEVRSQDTGGGISEEDLSSIFDSFFTTKSKGTGLGLAVTKQILDIHQASITIESEVGQGTLAIIRFLPMA